MRRAEEGEAAERARLIQEILQLKAESLKGSQKSTENPQAAAAATGRQATSVPTLQMRETIPCYEAEGNETKVRHAVLDHLCKWTVGQRFEDDTRLLCS